MIDPKEKQAMKSALAEMDRVLDKKDRDTVVEFLNSPPIIRGYGTNTRPNTVTNKTI